MNTVPYDNNSTQAVDPFSAAKATSSVPTQTTEVANPVLEALGGALKRQQEEVNKAAELVNKTPQYTSGSSAQPTMPVAKNLPFQGASSKNVANEHPETRAGARNKAVGQIAGQAGALIGKYFKKKEDEKTQALAIDLHKSMELQQGMDEAKQVLAQDPNNAQAKATLQKNQTLLTSLLNGKSGKDIAKAYGVTFGPEAQSMSPDKKKDSMHAQAMTQAMKQVQQDQKLKDFEGQLPERVQANPAYQSALAQYQQVAKTAEVATKTYTQMASKVYGEQSSTARAEAKSASTERIAAGRDDTAKTVAETRAKAEFETERLRSKTDIEKADKQAAAHIQGIRILKQSGDNDKAQKMAQTAFTATDTMIKDQNKQIDDLTAKIANPGQRAPDESEALLKARIEDHKKAIQQLTQQKDLFLMEMHSDPDAAALTQLLGNMDNQ